MSSLWEGSRFEEPISPWTSLKEVARSNKWAQVAVLGVLVMVAAAVVVLIAQIIVCGADDVSWTGELGLSLGVGVFAGISAGVGHVFGAWSYIAKQIHSI